MDSIRFITFKSFLKDWHDSGLSDPDLLKLKTTLSENPEKGDLIVGGGGCRKIRVALPNTGKSGGARTIYFYYNSRGLLFFLSVYRKSEKDDLTKAEVNELRMLVKELKQGFERSGSDV